MSGLPVSEGTVVKHFAGKFTLASVDPSRPTRFATPMTLQGLDASAPAMAATSVGPDETWLAYGTATGLILQMGDLQYLAQDDDVGTVVATRDVTRAARFRWSAVDPKTPATSTTLDILVDGGWQPVRYGVQDDLPTLLVFPIPGALPPDAGSITTFGRTTVTPSLDWIQSTKSAIGADLRDVDLSGEDLSGVGLSGADLTGATLDATTIVGGTLNGAFLRGVSMRGTNLTGTPLDGAQFDGSDVSTVIWGQGSSARGASFRGCTGGEAKVGSSVQADWSQAKLERSDFTGADFTNVNLSSAHLAGCTLVGAILQSTNLSLGDARRGEGPHRDGPIVRLPRQRELPGGELLRRDVLVRVPLRRVDQSERDRDFGAGGLLECVPRGHQLVRGGSRGAAASTARVSSARISPSRISHRPTTAARRPPWWAPASRAPNSRRRSWLG